MVVTNRMNNELKRYTVTIFVTKDEGPYTMNSVEGSGDWFSRYGLMRCFLSRVEEKIKTGTLTEYETGVAGASDEADK